MATGSISLTPPMAYQVILEPGIGQFREFESARVLTQIYLRGTFSWALTDLRKAQDREPYARTIMKAITGRGGKGRHM